MGGACEGACGAALLDTASPPNLESDLPDGRSLLARSISRSRSSHSGLRSSSRRSNLRSSLRSGSRPSRDRSRPNLGGGLRSRRNRSGRSSKARRPPRSPPLCSKSPRPRPRANPPLKLAGPAKGELSEKFEPADGGPSLLDLLALRTSISRGGKFLGGDLSRGGDGGRRSGKSRSLYVRGPLPRGGASLNVRGGPLVLIPPGGGPRGGGPSNCDLGPLGASALRGGGPLLCLPS